MINLHKAISAILICAFTTTNTPYPSRDFRFPKHKLAPGSRFTNAFQGDEKLRLERQEEIDSFVRGKMTRGKRRAFVNELKNNQLLRSLVRQHRANLPETEVRISEKTHGLLSEAFSMFHSGNLLFPGSDYSAGNERRPSNSSQREDFYRRAIESFNQLIQIGELEDIAFENIWRIKKNRVNAYRELRHFEPYDEWRAIGIAFANFGKPQRESVEGRLEPLGVSFQRDTTPREELLRLNFDDTANVRRLIARLGEFYPNTLRHLVEFPEPQNAAKTLRNEADLRRIVDENPLVIRALEQFVQLPITTLDWKREVGGKLVAASLVLHHYERTGEIKSLNTVTMYFENLLAKNRKKLFKNHLRNIPVCLRDGLYDLLDTMHLPWALLRLLVPTPYSYLKSGTSEGFQREFFMEGLLNLLLARSDSSDLIWQRVRYLIFRELDAGRFGLPSNRPSDEYDSDRYLFISCLSILENRLRHDQGLRERVTRLISDKDEHVRLAALNAYDKMRQLVDSPPSPPDDGAATILPGAIAPQLPIAPQSLSTTFNRHKEAGTSL